MTVSTNTNGQWSGSGRRRGGWARLRSGLKKGALSGQGRPSRAGSKSFGSGARALRKYACDANPAKRQTVHVSVDCK
eukprot:6212341-Pleurochrysis_carterae.AAC.1